MEIVIQNVTKKFDNNIILDNVSLNMEEGKVYGFVGRNGSGKSVLLKIICGFYLPTSGDVLFDGESIVKNKNFLPDTRVLIEKPSFLPNISGFENLKLLSSIQNKITDDKINETLDLVNLAPSDRSKKFHKYSLGMKQKLGLAQVFMEDPKIMILDEPFNGIEDGTIEKLREYLLQEKKRGKIIIIATHIKEDISTLVDVLYKFDNQTVQLEEN